MNKFANKPLIIPVYSSRKKEFYDGDDLEQFDWLVHYLGEVNEGEAYISSLGVEFLKEKYGLTQLSELLFDNKWYFDQYKSASEIYEFLKWLEENPGP